MRFFNLKFRNFWIWLELKAWSDRGVIMGTTWCIINFNCNLLSCGWFDSIWKADMLRIAQDFGAQNERLRQRTCFDCRTLQNGKFATQSTALATKTTTATTRTATATATATATHTNCFNCNKFLLVLASTRAALGPPRMWASEQQHMERRLPRRLATRVNNC